MTSTTKTTQTSITSKINVSSTSTSSSRTTHEITSQELLTQFDYFLTNKLAMSLSSGEFKTLKSQKVFTGTRLENQSKNGYVLLLLDASIGYLFSSHDIIQIGENSKSQRTVEIRQGASYVELKLVSLQTTSSNIQYNDQNLRRVVEYWKKTNGGCALGDDVKNNCAHFLSDAFIRAGYSELRRVESEVLQYKEKKMFTAWCDFISTPNRRNDNARPIRAREMRKWFITKKVQVQMQKPSNCGCWAAYFREFSSEGSQEHVFIYDSNTGEDYGSGQQNKGNYWKWEVQEFYQW